MARHVRPIPKRLLIHNITARAYATDTPFGKQLLPEVAINRVRLQPAFKLRRSYEGTDVDIKTVLFMDCVNTEGAIALPTKSKVKWNGVEMNVVECQLVYALDGTTPHHYEVLLV